MRQHWAKYGRNYYSRYDYETVDSAAANTMVSQLLAMGDAFREAGYGPTNPKPLADGFLLSVVDEFCYTDPIDGSVSANQGVRLLFDDGSRVVFWDAVDELFPDFPWQVRPRGRRHNVTVLSDRRTMEAGVSPRGLDG